MGILHKDEFYYPSAEEIRVGFEGEVNWNRGYEETYDPIVLTLTKDGKNECCGQQSHDVDLILETCIWDGMSEIRVPLLTKEQVEKEGWDLEHSNTVIDIYVMEKSTLPLQSFSLVVGYDHWIIITRVQGDHKSICYEGPCPTINHLRDIMRLLNIKKDGTK